MLRAALSPEVSWRGWLRRSRTPSLAKSNVIAKLHYFCLIFASSRASGMIGLAMRATAPKGSVINGTNWRLDFRRECFAVPSEQCSGAGVSGHALPGHAISFW
jgi:hypothetical protein